MPELYLFVYQLGVKMTPRRRGNLWVFVLFR